jgi:hypothetical protein
MCKATYAVWMHSMYYSKGLMPLCQNGYMPVWLIKFSNDRITLYRGHNPIPIAQHFVDGALLETTWTNTVVRSFLMSNDFPSFAYLRRMPVATVIQDINRTGNINYQRKKANKTTVELSNKNAQYASKTRE